MWRGFIKIQYTKKLAELAQMVASTSGSAGPEFDSRRGSKF